MNDMKIKTIFTAASLIMALSSAAQPLSFSFRTNNQQLIDDALDGTFVKVCRYYELCDTVNHEFFGRNDKDYFNIIPFIGIKTERGIVLPIAAEKPWINDEDFYEYHKSYKPIISKTTVSNLNAKVRENRVDLLHHQATTMGEYLTLFSDSTTTNYGLYVDSVSGAKEGWLIWLSSEDDLINVDSIHLTCFKKRMEVIYNENGWEIDKPELKGNIYGGIYVTPRQTSIGQITFYLTGVVVSDEKSTRIIFPFIKKSVKSKKSLTPITNNGREDLMNSFKKN